MKKKLIIVDILTNEIFGSGSERYYFETPEEVKDSLAYVTTFDDLPQANRELTRAWKFNEEDKLGLQNRLLEIKEVIIFEN